MNVLVIGGGGREHALVWALKQSKDVETVWCAPGNPGIELLARCVDLKISDNDAVNTFIQEKSIGLTVVGPEAPLVNGLADVLRESGKRVFGPTRAAARLEGSKVFAKNFMKTYGIPTADFQTFSYPEEASSFMRSGQWTEDLRVVKASGLAAGKGVVLCPDKESVTRTLDDVMVKKVFGAAGDQVVLEEILEGEELSVLALCDGTTLLPLVPAQDHKRAFDNDQGPNTGGMGAYSPVPALPDSLWKEIDDKVFAPFLRGLREENLNYCGVIYFGLMLTKNGPKVLEFNVRFGDPETQAVVPLVENDWLELFLATVERRLKDVQLRRRAGAAVCVVMAAGGYPGDYKKGKVIQGLDAFSARKDILIFHAGTARGENSSVVTAGGRVLGITGLGADFESARQKAYEAAGAIHFDGAHFRRDIGARAMARSPL